MLQSSLQAVVLAAGRSSRFTTSKTKLSHRLCGQELIAFPLQLLSELQIPTTLILGYQKELILPLIDQYMPSALWVEQKEQRGTGHAVLCTQSLWTADHILVLNGDVPLLEKSDIEALIEKHISSHATVSCIATYNADPSVKGYGRIIKDGSRIAIVEQREFTGNPAEQCLLNAGIYIFKRTFLEKTLPFLTTREDHHEIYITDLIEKANSLGEKIELIEVPFDHVRGVNTLHELWIVEHIKKSMLITTLMKQGVRFIAPQSVSIDIGVTIGQDSVIGYGAQLRGKTAIGSNVVVEPFCVVEDALIDTNAVVHSHSVITTSHLHRGVVVGPFAHIHKQSILEKGAVIGNFVEVSKSTIGERTKAKHLAYIGNARVGSEVTIGAGAITCNYNGVTKNVTTIEDKAFIGTNVSLVAPVTIGERALVAAGSTITKNVPADALAIAREPQTTKEQYAPLLKERYQRAAHKPSTEKVA